MPASAEPRFSPSGQTILAETPKLIQPSLRRLRAFGWTCLILLAAVGVCVLVVVLLSPTAHGLPKARLLLLKRIEQKPQEDPSGSFITFDPAAPYPAPEMWKAEFEIRVPTNSMIGLTHREIGVEVLGDNGMWTAAKPFLGDRIPDYLRLGTRGISRNGSLLVPAGTRSCRFTIGYRLPTRREQRLAALWKVGIMQRFPKISHWVWDHSSAAENWLVSRQEVQLSAFPDVEVPGNSK